MFQAALRRWILCASLCLVVQPVLGQLPGSPLPRPQIPDESAPNTKPSKHHPTASKDVAEKLRKGFDTKNAAYAGSNIQAAVDDQTVTLTGKVTSSTQHEMALQLARAYADDRKIVDRLVVE